MKNQKLLPKKIYEMQAEVCGSLANPVRLMILDLLSENELTASDIQTYLELPKSNLSQHINVLKRAGILSVRTEGKFQFLSLKMPEIKAACALVRKVLVEQKTKENDLIKELKKRG
ncbi:MAG: metalloregulator ArsR/SmtB family transcription factor [Oligoflexia bacterium]|nr:metalloregulator ArsR/SmtB family transcription factor [Oligoflexia bacterium]